MGTLVVDSEEVGRRIRLLRQHGLALSGRAFAQYVLGVNDSSLASKLEAGQVTHDRMKEIAKGASGQMALRDASYEDVLAFLEGEKDELPLALYSGLTFMRVIEDPASRPNREARRRSTALPEAGKGYFTLRSSGLRLRVA